MDLKLLLAILVGKSIRLLNKLLGTGATAAPGLYALKIDPSLVKKLSKNIKNGAIIISGTNGKTTTARLASDILYTKHKIIHNRQGSNLLRGIASTLIDNASILGKIEADLALWEVDEATLPQAIQNTSPKTVLLLNLFRDQLDRYGEVDSVRKKWQEALLKLPKDSTLILNADDPGISFLSKFTKGNVIYFGVNDASINLPTIDHVADIKYCLNCSSKLIYSSLLSAHLGNYHCPHCGFKRPTPNTYATNLKFSSDFSTSAKITINRQPLTINYPLPGLYNVYNILASVALSNTFNAEFQIIKEKTEKFSAAFGRFQKLKVNGKKIIIFLIKNPTGANEVLRTLAPADKLNLLVILNDKIADGRDVSWIWDTNWETLNKKINRLSISGTRAWDMATRLKYADFELSKNNIYREIYYSILDSVRKLNNKNTLIILPTYTSLLQVQKSLSKLGTGIKWYKQ